MNTATPSDKPKKPRRPRYLAHIHRERKRRKTLAQRDAELIAGYDGMSEEPIGLNLAQHRQLMRRLRKRKKNRYLPTDELLHRYHLNQLKLETRKMDPDERQENAKLQKKLRKEELKAKRDTYQRLRRRVEANGALEFGASIELLPEKRRNAAPWVLRLPNGKPLPFLTREMAMEAWETRWRDFFAARAAKEETPNAA